MVKKKYPSKFPLWGIRGRLILLLLVVLIPVLLIETFIYYRTFETRKSEEFRANLEVARAVAKNFDTFVQDMARSELVIGLALTPSRPITDRDRNRILDNFRADNPAVRSVYWINLDGFIVASALRTLIGLDISDRPYFKEIIAGRDWSISELILGRATGKPTFTICRGIRNEQKKLLGVVAAAIEPDHLDSVLGIDRSKEAGISLVDNKGMHVYRYPFIEYTMEQRNWLKHYPMIDDCFKGKDVLTSVISEATGKRRLIAFTPVSSIGWVAAASRDEEEVMETITETLRFQAGLVLLVTLLVFGAAAAFSRPISNSIIRLRNHALALGRGEREPFAITSGPQELQDLAQALNQMASEVRLREQQLEEANKELESFIYSISHDLRSPLRIIDVFSQMLMQKYGDKLDEDDTRRFKGIRRNAGMMSLLIEDLLSFSRVRNNSMNIAEIDMGNLVSEVWGDIQSAQEERELEFKTTELLPGFGDRTLIKQVLFNLFSNAVKFTKNRQPGIFEMSSHQEADQVIYCLRDNGAGFDMAYYDKLFGVFQRLHSAEEYEGTGVGLAIVQRIVKRHGGRVWAEGEVDKGATFCFSLPRNGDTMNSPNLSIS